MAKSVSTQRPNNVNIRMYKGGTGDCFLLQFRKGKKATFNMMIDCGCIKGGIKQFEDITDDLMTQTGGIIDLLLVTHEHADHINGFDKAKDIYDKFTFKKVWFAWTEDDEDPIANDYRSTRSELGMALNSSVNRLNELLTNGHYEAALKDEMDKAMMIEGKKNFISSLSALNELNFLKAAGDKPLPTMVELFTGFNVIKDDTQVELLEPGDVRTDLPCAKGIKFYIMGPPRNHDYLDETENEEENYTQREKPSKTNFAFLAATDATLQNGRGSKLPFENEFELTNPTDAVVQKYNAEQWRQINNDWLYSAGSLAMRYERSINNTSLAVAIQFEDSERVLLFPADAELGSWKSWHDGLTWPVKIDNKTVKKNAEYFLNHTVFYKVGHHLSHNGTAIRGGIEMMTSGELTVMGTLDFVKINKGWLNTMPNDLLSAELIKLSHGNFYVNGNIRDIIKNMKTDRVNIKTAHETTMLKVNDEFKDEIYLECNVKG